MSDDTKAAGRRGLEKALRESAEKYKFLIEATNTGFVILDDKGRVVDANQEYIRMTGHSRLEDVLGRAVTDWTASYDLERNAAEVGKCMATGSVRNLVIDYVDAKGRIVRVEINATVLPGPPSARIFTVCRDITERKRAEESLRQSEERFKAITMTASDAILLMDDMGKIVYWNPAAERIFGYTAGEAIGQQLHMFLAPPRLHSGYQEGFTRFVMTGQGPVINRSVEMAAMKKDRTEFPIEVSTSAMNINGRWHALGIVRDITERKQLEQELLKSQKLESIGTLAGGIAHDFNNLLQGIFGYISMAKLTIDQREKSLAMLAQAEKALHLSVNLTSQLLTFAKGGKPVKKVVNLRPVIEDAVKFALSGSRNEASISVPEDLRTVEIDEGQVGQVVQNIVLNADQAMPLGGRITVSARNVPASEAAPLPSARTGDVVEFTIQDQGTGIPAEHLSRIFDPYFTTKDKGSGLGLATSYSIIKNHGGVITVASEMGRGTTFTIYLPASGASDERGEASAPIAVGKKGRILVMDDEQVVREVTGELLRTLGHEVEFAEHGKEALEKYHQAMKEDRPYDVVILDLTIRGGMGGAEAVKKLVELNPNVKAIMSSGYSDDAVTADYRKQGFAAFLKKPYNITELQKTLHTLLS